MKNIWEWLNGKKTVLAVVAYAAVYGAKGLGWLPSDLADTLLRVIEGFGVVGVVHKGYKAGTKKGAHG